VRRGLFSTQSARADRDSALFKDYPMGGGLRPSRLRPLGLVLFFRRDGGWHVSVFGGLFFWGGGGHGKKLGAFGELLLWGWICLSFRREPNPQYKWGVSERNFPRLFGWFFGLHFRCYHHFIFSISRFFQMFPLSQIRVGTFGSSSIFPAGAAAWGLAFFLNWLWLYDGENHGASGVGAEVPLQLTRFRAP